MTELVTPDLRWYDDWVATLTDFGAEYPHGSGCAPDGQPLDRSAFEEFVADKLLFADPTAELPNGWVSCDYFWIVDAGEMIGFLALRHRLNDYLLEQGGHIGYSVRPARRREGHASRALALAVSRAAELGLDRVLVTCDDDNLGSRRTIENGGGELEDVRAGKRRYWISTARDSVGGMIAG
ncbi:GNAT family N-acetyltransferase [Nocardioides sp. MAHUQ-72]|uniref:GNAT family N-acetyltransferase n=1 Tax=unclassified Nocardioides TaxID=2615069 RepID=UPI003611AA22